jgi:hypothetical protein
MMAATDYASNNAMCEVAGDMFRKMGFNLDYQSLDWAPSPCVATARRLWIKGDGARIAPSRLAMT